MYMIDRGFEIGRARMADRLRRAERARLAELARASTDRQVVRPAPVASLAVCDPSCDPSRGRTEVVCDAA